MILLKMPFLRDSCVTSAIAPGIALPPASMQSSVLKSSCIVYTLRFCAQCFLALTKNKSIFRSILKTLVVLSFITLSLLILNTPARAFDIRVFSFISRQHEFEADDFAASQAQTENLITALVSLYRENANTLTPDPLYSAFHDSHPPTPIRIAHLKSKFA